MKQKTNNVNPKTGTLKTKIGAFSGVLGNTVMKAAAPLFLVASVSAGTVQARKADTIGSYAVASTHSEGFNDSSQLEGNGPGKPRMRPVQIMLPSPKAVRLADYEVTRNMINSLVQPAIPAYKVAFNAADNDIHSLFLSETRVFVSPFESSDEEIDGLFRIENLDMSAISDAAEADLSIDAAFRAENETLN